MFDWLKANPVLYSREQQMRSPGAGSGSSYGAAAFLSFAQRTRSVCVTYLTCHICAIFLSCMHINNVAASNTRSSCYVSRSISYVS